LFHYYISTHKNPLNVFKYIASGVFGKKHLHRDHQ